MTESTDFSAAVTTLGTAEALTAGPVTDYSESPSGFYNKSVSADASWSEADLA